MSVRGFCSCLWRGKGGEGNRLDYSPLQLGDIWNLCALIFLLQDNFFLLLCLPACVVLAAITHYPKESASISFDYSIYVSETKRRIDVMHWEKKMELTTLAVLCHLTCLFICIQRGTNLGHVYCIQTIIQSTLLPAVVSSLFPYGHVLYRFFSFILIVNFPLFNLYCFIPSFILGLIFAGTLSSSISTSLRPGREFWIMARRMAATNYFSMVWKRMLLALPLSTVLVDPETAEIVVVSLPSVITVTSSGAMAVLLHPWSATEGLLLPSKTKPSLLTI